MSEPYSALLQRIEEKLGNAITKKTVARGELTLETTPDNILSVCQTLRDDPRLGFEQLIDLCGVDYLHYRHVTLRGNMPAPQQAGEDRDAASQQPSRFAVVYHLLSIKNNQRVRVRVFLADDEMPKVPSVFGIWNAANWFEREAYDLFGILFEGHPDLRRILTDYGFNGHPFRKDFPLIGEVEVRYDPDKGRVVNEPVSIEPRVLVPRVIREEGFGG